METTESQQNYNGASEHLRLINHEITTEQYVAGLKDNVDKRFGFGKYKGRPEGLAARSPKKRLLKQLGSLYLEAFNPYTSLE